MITNYHTSYLPLVYEPKYECSNILLIDSNIKDYQHIVNSVNYNTTAIVYYNLSTKEDLSFVLSNFNNISRIGFIFLSKPNCPITFLDNEPFFSFNYDLSIDCSSENLLFLTNIFQKYNIHNVDYLGCNTLNYPEWNNYYNFLIHNTSTSIGASDNKTGNIKYGGDWILENTSQDIETVYFTQNIEYYKYLFDSIGTNATKFKFGALDLSNNFSSIDIVTTPLYNGQPFYSGFYSYYNGSKCDLSQLYHINSTINMNASYATNMYTIYNGSKYDLSVFFASKPLPISNTQIITSTQIISFSSTITKNVILVSGGGAGGLGGLGAARGGGGGGGCVGQGSLIFIGGVNYTITVGLGLAVLSGGGKNTKNVNQNTTIIGGSINETTTGGGRGGPAGDGGTSGTGIGTLTYSPAFGGAASNTKACGGGGAGGSPVPGGADNPIPGVGKSYTINSINYILGTGGRGGSIVTGASNTGTGGGGGASGGSGIVILY